MDDELRPMTVERMWKFDNVHMSRHRTCTVGRTDHGWYARFSAGPLQPFADQRRAELAARTMMNNYLAAQRARPYLGGGPGVGEWVEVEPS